jgi:hypothetical protein
MADLPIDQAQTDILARKYHQPDTSNLINYLNFYNEFKTSVDKKLSAYSAQGPIQFQQTVSVHIFIYFRKKRLKLNFYFCGI